MWCTEEEDRLGTGGGQSGYEGKSSEARGAEGSARMSLTSQLSGDFDGAVRQRGGDYFHSGRVQIESGSAMRVVATVRGSSRYSVKLEREGPQIVASCTCPYFDVDACKHIWAVVLAAASRGL